MQQFLWHFFPFKCFANKYQTEDYTKRRDLWASQVICTTGKLKIAPHEISRKFNNSFSIHCPRCNEKCQRSVDAFKFQVEARDHHVRGGACVWMTQHIFQLPAKLISFLLVDVDSIPKGIKFVVLLSDMRQVMLRRISRWGFFSGPFLNLLRLGDLVLFLNVLLVYSIILREVIFLKWNILDKEEIF